MPQPPPSMSRALVSLTLPSHTNKHFDPISEFEDDNSESQQQLKSRTKMTVDTDVLNDENEYSVSLSASKRQSSRIQKRKNVYSTVSHDSSGRKKKKN